MKYVIIIARVLLGLVFAVFGSNAFLHFIAMPPMQGPGNVKHDPGSCAAKVAYGPVGPIT